MKLLHKVAKLFFQSKPSLIKFGQTSAICPYCETNLPKFPGRKTKCKSCSKFMYVRTRPLDGQKILLRNDELLLCEEQWSIKNGVWEEFKAQQDEIEEIREQKRRAYGFEPPEGDVQWALLNKRSIEYATSRQWGLYRNNQFHMAEQLSSEGKYLQALHHLSVVMMFDVNGAMNCGENVPKELQQDWNLDLAFLAPGIISKYENIAVSEKFDSNKCRQIFSEANKAYADGGYNMPLSIDEAWDKIEAELNLET